MNTELIQELNLLQQSRCNRKYIDILEENVYSPIQEANNSVTTWASKRGQMLLKMESASRVRFYQEQQVEYVFFEKKQGDLRQQ